jgi:hypothetical protein
LYVNGSNFNSEVFLPYRGFVELSIISSIAETSEPHKIKNIFFDFKILSIAF